jgi:hypothetical protein
MQLVPRYTAAEILDEDLMGLFGMKIQKVEVIDMYGCTVGLYKFNSV